ncbi:hypothetical protein [Microbacterium sp. BH-3-3-3]|nr:hypothetical protein [Microbacterium sp. BH-3-3-3]
MSQIQAVLRRRDVELASRDADAPAELTPQDVAAALDEVRNNSGS